MKNMSKRLSAISIEIDISAAAPGIEIFSQRTIHALLSGLSVVYEEVFIWSFRQYIIVWVVGDQADLLRSALAHHQRNFKSAEVIEGNKSIDCFMEIIDGSRWQDVSAVNKLSSLNEAYELAAKLNAVGLILTPMIANGLTKLTHHPSVTGARNSWHHAESKIKQPGIIKIRSSDMFFRFSVN